MSSVLRIAEDLTNNKKNPIYRAYVKSRAVTCIMQTQKQADHVRAWPDLKLWPPLLMVGHTPGSKFYSFIYDVVLLPVEWGSIRTTRNIHARLSDAMAALHTNTACVLYPDKATGQLTDIMAEAANPATYYFVNFSHVTQSKSAAAYHADQIKLIDMLCKSPVVIDSTYKFYKYLAKSSVYPQITRLIKEKPNTSVYFIKIRLLFMLKHFDLYLRACGVSEPTYNKLCNMRYPDAAYYIKHLTH